MQKLQKSTPAYVVTYVGKVVYGPACKTLCKRFASGKRDLKVESIKRL